MERLILKFCLGQSHNNWKMKVCIVPVSVSTSCVNNPAVGWDSCGDPVKSYKKLTFEVLKSSIQ